MMVDENHTNCSSSAFMVPKKNGTWRLVIDLREVNKRLKIIAGEMADIQAQMSWMLSGIEFNRYFDALSGFDMLPLTDRASKTFCIATVFRTFRLKGTAMGLINTPMAYQQRFTTYILGRRKGSFVCQTVRRFHAMTRWAMKDCFKSIWKSLALNIICV